MPTNQTVSKERTRNPVALDADRPENSQSLSDRDMASAEHDSGHFETMRKAFAEAKPARTKPGRDASGPVKGEVLGGIGFAKLLPWGLVATGGYLLWRNRARISQAFSSAKGSIAESAEKPVGRSFDPVANEKGKGRKERTVSGAI